MQGTPVCQEKFPVFFLFFLEILPIEVLHMKILEKILLFIFGGLCYVALELLWRGWSHMSMFFAGGTCFLLLGGLERAQPRLPLPLRGIFGAVVITSVEMLCGLLFNRSYQVWDYRETPFNFHGQICLPFFLLWIPLSLVGMQLFTLLEDLMLLARQWRFAKLPKDAAYGPGLSSKRPGRKYKDR